MRNALAQRKPTNQQQNDAKRITWASWASNESWEYFFRTDLAISLQKCMRIEPTGYQQYSNQWHGARRDHHWSVGIWWSSHTTGWCLSYVSQICLSLIIMNPEFWLKNRMPSSMMIPYQPAYPLVGQTWLENSSIYFGHFAKEREDCADFSGFKGGKTSVFLKARRWVWERSNTCKHWHITCKEWGFDRHNMGICQMFVVKVITLTINIYQQWVPGAIYV